MASKLLQSVLLVVLLTSCGDQKARLTERQIELANQLKPLTQDYLVKHIGSANFGGKPFCGYEVLGIEEKQGAISQYVWAFCQEYSSVGGELKLGTGSSLPVALTIEQQDGGHVITSYKVPRDGGAYTITVQEIFPEDVQGKIFSGGGRQRLQKEVEIEAKAKLGIR